MSQSGARRRAVGAAGTAGGSRDPGAAPEPPASPARRAAFEVVRRAFEGDAWAHRAFRTAADRHGLRGRERAQAQRLAYGTVQRKGTLDWLCATLVDRPLAELQPAVIAALRLGLYELLFASATPDYAAVSQAVELARVGLAGSEGGRRRAEGAAGLVNAVLRRAARERRSLLASLDDATPEGAAIAHSHPEWLARLWWEELGPDEARSLMAAMNEPVETALRANVLRADPAELVAQLRERGELVALARDAPDVAAEGSGATRRLPAAGAEVPAIPEAIVVDGPLGDAARATMAAGDAVAQARGSQAAVALLDPRPGERVLDLCAGPGIKTTAIAARMRNQGEVVSVELSPARASELRELCERMGVSCVRVIEGDATTIDLGDGYDRALVDPPCTDLGTLASRPDARWRKSLEQADVLSALQGRILARAVAALRPSGVLVYSTCTISTRENEGVVAGALAEDPRLRADELGADSPALASSHDPRFLQLRPDRHGTDGFFLARLHRSQ